MEATIETRDRTKVIKCRVVEKRQPDGCSTYDVEVFFEHGIARFFATDDVQAHELVNQIRHQTAGANFDLFKA